MESNYQLSLFLHRVHTLSVLASASVFFFANLVKRENGFSAQKKRSQVVRMEKFSVRASFFQIFRRFFYFFLQSIIYMSGRLSVWWLLL